MNYAQELWNNTLPILEEELNTAIYIGYIQDLNALQIHNNTLTLITDDPFKQNVLSNRYDGIIKNALLRSTGRDYEVFFVLSGHEKKHPTRSYSYPTTLSPRYTFDSFVIGQSNHFAHAAANVVANNPGKSYNPLFIYGGVGLGKTHLMHAIGNQIYENNPNAKIGYVTSEKFTNEMITAIRSDQNEEFREKYRNLDVLMIDDIQFISNKEGTQVEFFNTFNHLYEDQKQIIISSDKPPKEIPTLEDRLRSRFEWGLQVDVLPPDYETRVAILQKKAELDNLVVPDSVLNFIAEKVKSNIRELEGTLTRVIAYSNLLGRDIDGTIASEALKDFISPDEKKEINAQFIKEVVADYYKISTHDLEGKRRNREIAFPRQIAMYLIREMTNNSLSKIGESFGDRHHSTVIHDCEKIENEIIQDSRLKITIDDIIERLNKS